MPTGGGKRSHPFHTDLNDLPEVLGASSAQERGPRALSPLALVLYVPTQIVSYVVTFFW